MKIYCVTHKPQPNINKLGLTPVGLGIESFPDYYLIENTLENIAHKNQYYSEVSFHYWIWKNILPSKKDGEWFGICQYRRYFVKKEFRDQIDQSSGNQGNLNINNLNHLKDILQTDPHPDWENYDAVLCDPWSVKVEKKMKIVKRGFRSLIKDPSILINKKNHNIKLHFDMYHGHGNLDKAINALPLKDKSDFIEYVNTNTELSGHSLFFCRDNKILNNYYSNLFDWLFECEKIFGFSDLVGYDTQRMYSFLSERYTAFWFKKYSKSITWPWVFYDISKDKD
tara:strand:+ start:1069 stop:1914 length:846 start_codon:yes stop_codon:yes gene_type:complete